MSGSVLVKCSLPSDGAWKDVRRVKDLWLPGGGSEMGSVISDFGPFFSIIQGLDP